MPHHATNAQQSSVLLAALETASGTLCLKSALMAIPAMCSAAPIVPACVATAQMESQDAKETASGMMHLTDASLSTGFLLLVVSIVDMANLPEAVINVSWEDRLQDVPGNVHGVDHPEIVFLNHPVVYSNVEITRHLVAVNVAFPPISVSQACITPTLTSLMPMRS